MIVYMQDAGNHSSICKKKFWQWKIPTTESETEMCVEEKLTECQTNNTEIWDFTQF